MEASFFSRRRAWRLRDDQERAADDEQGAQEEARREAFIAAQRKEGDEDREEGIDRVDGDDDGDALHGERFPVKENPKVIRDGAENDPEFRAPRPRTAHALTGSDRLRPLS